ncbi:MAG: LETM1-related biofilm-associated protein [Bacteroidota bacterium]
MNPSTSGWIENLCIQISSSSLPYKNYRALYRALKNFGFIYGVNVDATDAFDKIHKYSEDELAKINLITALYHIYAYKFASTEFTEFSSILLEFYEKLEVADLSLWDRLLIGKSKNSKLERLVNDRIHLEDNILTRNFNKSISNSLLFVDVLTFAYYLDTDGKIDVKSASANLEQIIVGTLYQSLNSKQKISDYDKEVIKIIETSTSYVNPELEVEDLIYDITYNIGPNEKKYLIDLMCLAIWDDEVLEKSEFQFLKNLAARLELPNSEINDSLIDVSRFRKKNRKTIMFFQQSNPISNFFENSSQLVNKLIRRNSKRLVKELQQSKDLLVLITKSTHTDLTKEEQKQMYAQIKDILKTIPSLAIFLLPGGAILLPIFAKLIPNILPSAFDDNRIEKNS